MDKSIKKALVIGGNGFIGFNLVKRLKSEGWYVAVIDIKETTFEKSPADEILIGDASDTDNLVKIGAESFDRIYQLAADMGGAGFIFTGANDADVMINSASINLNVADYLNRWDFKGKLFYSSSVCAYSIEQVAQKIKEEDIYPANPDSNYGWEKIFSERLYQACAKNKGLDIRIARFNNCYGPYSTYKGGREKSPAAICRKVIEANWSATTDCPIEIWGDGEQVREFIYIDDLLDAVELIMESDHKEPINIGPDTSNTINEMVRILAPHNPIEHIDGPVGLQVRLTDNTKIKSLGWSPKVPLEVGIKKTYLWIKEQYEKA